MSNRRIYGLSRVRDGVEAIEADFAVKLRTLLVDGGSALNAGLMQLFQAVILASKRNGPWSTRQPP